ncbi:Uracil DNA glycosylase superfamily protein [Planctomycetes bacterium Pla163]|uniref:Uracil DNA glycosylase superfamily protein n=1 Tax=Rohdeia mirabilis TaxID=2528008 RepID=A0A518CWD5_9BACT|nr:Uracil DNA glycosylase superfamily protein [Planctomycetes bacterium Pla163]
MSAARPRSGASRPRPGDAKSRVTKKARAELAARVQAIVDELSDAVDALAFADPVAHVYNPLDYARDASATFIERFVRPRPEAVLIGMNPGPWGMVQTGVPFGEVAAVRDWMGIDSGVVPPADQHPKRPIEGFACTRSEVSGRRVWGWAAERFGTPAAFFDRFFVWNFCPLAFMEEGGKNRTPDKLPAAEREALFEVCDRALVRMVEAIDPERVIGIGRFALDRARSAIGSESGRAFGTILHPSPASPLANRGWAPQAEAQLAALGIDLDR